MPPKSGNRLRGEISPLDWSLVPLRWDKDMHEKQKLKARCVNMTNCDTL